MKIAWDGRALVGPRTGIGWYTHHLLQAFSKVEGDWQGCLYTNRRVGDEFDARLTQKTIPFPNTVHLRSVWERCLLPRTLSRNPVDLWHSPMAVIPSKIEAASVATVHDVAFHLFPEIQPPSYRRYWQYWTERACRCADRIIAVSESTRQDLLKHFGADPARVAVVHEAADPTVAQPASEGEVREVSGRFRIPPRFLLFVGTLEPRKNLGFLLDVLDCAQARGAGLPPLLVAGGKGWLHGAVEKRFASFGEKVRWVGYLNRTELRVLYQLATLILVPSRYEGFGLQAAEALAAGAVVVSSNLSSLPEVVGEGGILLPVQDPEVWVQTIAELVENRTELASWKERARRWSTKFSWERAARETFAVYSDAIRNRR